MFQIRPRRALAALACTSVSIAALSIAAPAAHADALGNAIANDASSYVGRDHTMGPWNEYWCADFVKRVWTENGVPAASWMTASVPTWINSPNYHPIGTYTPQPGDAIIWNDDNYNDSTTPPNPGSHISIVTSYTNGLLSDVGGDENGSGSGSAFWSSSHVYTNEAGSGPFDPTKKLFAGTSYEMWVRGYISPGAATQPPAAPTVTVGGPAANAVVSGSTTLTASASDSTTGATLSTQFYVDGTAVGSPVSGTSPSLTWSSAGVADGPHTVTATTKATNTGGTTSASSAGLNVLVNNGNLQTFASARESNGALRVFGINSSGQVWTSLQNSPNGSWPVAWAMLGSTASNITAGTEHDGRIVLVDRSSTDNSIWFDEETQPGSGVFNTNWAKIGAAGSGAPVLVRENDGRLVVFAQNLASGVFWYDEETNFDSAAYNTNWASVGGPALGLTATTESDGRIVLVERGNDQNTWFDEETALNSAQYVTGWTKIGGATASTPVTGHEQDGRIVVFAQDPTTHTYWYNEETQSGSASYNASWASVGGPALDLTTANESDGRMVLLERGTDRTIWFDEETSVNGAGFVANWTNIGQASAMAVTNAAQGNNALALFSQNPTDQSYWTVGETGPGTAAYNPSWVNISH